MARLPRLTLPGYPHHVIQRGNNRQSIFMDAQDYEVFLRQLTEQALKHGVAVHAYVLMENHFHLLATPDTALGLPQMMQHVGRSYAQYFNRRHGRTGTLWEGRYRSAVLEAEAYLLPCMVFLDLNAIRSGVVLQASDYQWSSAAHWLGLRHDRLLSPHMCYWALGNTPFAREAAYLGLLDAGLAASQQKLLMDSASDGWALGSAAFIEEVQGKTTRRVSRSQPGRPRKTPSPD
jgi:putative transposase